MKVVLFCGGKGTRWTRHDDEAPKAMALVGDRPILWHVMTLYSASGFNEFVLCLGFKGSQIVRYFEHAGGVYDARSETLRVTPTPGVTWHIDLVDTGEDTEIGGRLLAIAPRLGGSRFMASYADGVAALDINELLRFHIAHGRRATITAVRPRSQYGIIQVDGNGLVGSIVEKPQMLDWINGGFFVFEPAVLDRVDAGKDLEEGPLSALARESQLMAYKTDRFWASLDTYKDKLELERLWRSGHPPWSTWECANELLVAGIRKASS